jgi:hypothetical protein
MSRVITMVPTTVLNDSRIIAEAMSTVATAKMSAAHPSRAMLPSSSVRRDGRGLGARIHKQDDYARARVMLRERCESGRNVLKNRNGPGFVAWPARSPFG